MTARMGRSSPSSVPLYLGRETSMDLDVDLDRVVEPTPSRRIRTQATRQRSRAERGELAGFVRVRHAGRAYCGWYRVAGDLLTVYCGVAANTGLLPDTLPSPKPLAERLLRELVDAEHPGLNPD